jgi:hypothetical protein
MKLHVMRRARLVLRNLQGIGDVARSYNVLHPLPLGAKLGKGLRENPGDARLLAPVLESQLTSPKRFSDETKVTQGNPHNCVIEKDWIKAYNSGHSKIYKAQCRANCSWQLQRPPQRGPQ